MATASINITYEDPTPAPPPPPSPPLNQTPEPVDTRTLCEKYPDLPECQGGSGPTGVSPPTIDAITAANIGGNNIRVTTTGSNYKSGAIARILDGSSTGREATNNNVTSPTSFQCDFDMSNVSTGEYMFSLSNPDGGSATAKIQWTSAPSSTPTPTTPTPTTPTPTTPTPIEPWYTPSPSLPPANWTPPEGCAIATEDVELTDGFIIPKGSTICNDGSVLLTDGTWLPAGTAIASHIKGGNLPAGGGVNLLAVGAVVVGLGALGYYMYSKRGER
jgi:hypothetical protein